jgi:hypothetical protein
MTDWQARVGDEVSVESRRLRGSRRRGEIVEVLGASGREYYRVRWEDGRETLFHPSSDAVLHPKGRRPRPRARTSARRKPPQEAGAPKKEAAPAPEPRYALRATPGDRLIIRGHHLGEPDRDGEILEVLGEEGAPPFKVRWSDTGREALFFPGPDAVVEHFRRRRSATRKA